MFQRRSNENKDAQVDEPVWFDDYNMRLGDVMRGERATMGKSLLDVERELRIKASYVAAIENADPDAFETPGFIPGYVRSYARYLNMDPDRAYGAFCAESGFSAAHGMSAAASTIRRPDGSTRKENSEADPLVAPATPFLPAPESFLSRIEPGALGSAMVLIALIAAIGYGGWSVLNEVQRVQLAPVENTPDVLADLDPLQTIANESEESNLVGVNAGFTAPRVSTEEGLDRLYRPEALEVPVLVARDAPISTLNPAEVGALAPSTPDRVAQAGPDQLATPEPLTPQVVEEVRPDVQIVAVRPAWVRVTAPDGSTLFEAIMNAGDTYEVPTLVDPAKLRVGESGAIYFAMGDQHYGPAGPDGTVSSNIALASANLTELYEAADLQTDQDLLRYVAELNAPAAVDPLQSPE